MEWLQALDRHGRVTAVPFQNTQVREAWGLTLAECQQAAWAITPEGQRTRGAMAIRAALAWALGASWMLWVGRLPGVARLESSVYAWIAAHRTQLPGTCPYCEQHPQECE